MGMRAAQNGVLAQTFDRTVRVLHRISCAAVQESVVAPGRTVCEVASFNQDSAKTAQSRIPGHAGSGCPAANHQDFRF